MAINLAYCVPTHPVSGLVLSVNSVCKQINLHFAVGVPNEPTHHLVELLISGYVLAVRHHKCCLVVSAKYVHISHKQDVSDEPPTSSFLVQHNIACNFVPSR